MSDLTHALLNDIIAADGFASECGCGLEPRLLELLLDRHATRLDCEVLGRTIRQDGPPQPVPPGLPRIGCETGTRAQPGAADARR